MKYVYVLRVGADHYKVGVALSVTKRIKGLQTSLSQKIVVIGVRLVNNPMEVEAKLHKYLDKYRLPDGGREWFKLSQSKLIRVLTILNEEPEIAGLAEQLNVKQMLLKHESEFDFMFENISHIREYLQREFEENLALELEKERLQRKRLLAERPKSQNAKVSLEVNDEELYNSILPIIYKEGKASTSLIQRRIRVGYSRAARMMEMLEERGVVSHPDGMRARYLLPLETRTN